jgi:hypothetical protein
MEQREKQMHCDDLKRPTETPTRERAQQKPHGKEPPHLQPDRTIAAEAKPKTAQRAGGLVGQAAGHR